LNDGWYRLEGLVLVDIIPEELTRASRGIPHRLGIPGDRELAEMEDSRDDEAVSTATTVADVPHPNPPYPLLREIR